MRKILFKFILFVIASNGPDQVNELYGVGNTKYSDPSPIKCSSVGSITQHVNLNLRVKGLNITLDKSPFVHIKYLLKVELSK